MTASLYEIKKGFAMHNNLLIYFAAKPIVETEKAVYLYGHGTTESVLTGVCCKCGRTLTHPVSVELGIGPECGGHYHNWDLIGGYTLENIERLKGALVDIKVDTWIPKSQIVSIKETSQEINIPSDHPMLNRDKKKEFCWAGLVSDGQGNRLIKIMFPFDTKTLALVKSLPSRKWNSVEKFWTVPFTVNSANLLKGWGFMLGEKLCEALDNAEARMNMPKPVLAPLVSENLNKLMPFQKEGVSLIEQRNGRVLLADEMGLGKTVQALSWLEMHASTLKRTICVVPASVKRNWSNEAYKWMTNPKVEILSGEKPYTLSGNLIVINYDILPAWIDVLRKFKPQVLIMDEAHKIKSNTAKRTKAMKLLSKGIPHVLALTGTPIVNRPVEIFNAIHIVNPDLFSSPWAFYMRYCGAHHNGYGWDFNGASNTKELHEILVKSVMIRRLKKDVLPELPDKVHTHIPMDITNWNDYASAEGNFIQFVKTTRGEDAAIKASKAQALAIIETLKQLAVRGKLAHAVEWVEETLEENDKLVLFAHHKFVIDALMEKFKDIAVKIDGSVATSARQQAVDKFQNDPSCKLIIISEAGAEGITLTAASVIGILELPWTPGMLDQITDRLHRIGQKCSVNIYYLLAEGTIEEKIARILDHKRQVLAAVLDGKDADEESMLMEIINAYK